MKGIGNKSNSFIQIFDMEREQGSEMKVVITLLDSLDSCGMTMLGNSLYLCGTSSYCNESSFFLKFDPEFQPALNILVNTKEFHFKPAMTSLFKESIFVIGGLNSTKCEKYNLKVDKWRPLPDLPER